MKLAEFKKQFVDKIDKLKDCLDKIRGLLLSEDTEKDYWKQIEDYSQYGFRTFCDYAKEELLKVQEVATRIYYYAVKDDFDLVKDDLISEHNTLTPLCQDLYKLYEEIEIVSFCLYNSYNKLTNDYLEARELDLETNKDSAETFTNCLIQFLDEQIEAAGEIISFIE